MMPDPGTAAADPANPQSWNRYAYVMNNPLNATDPLGLQSASQNDQCSPNSARPIGDGTDRVPGLECGTGAIDGSDPHSPKTPAPIVVPGQTITVTAEPSAVEILEAHESLFLQLVNGTWRPTSTTPNVAANNCVPGSSGCYNVPTQKETCLAEYNNSAAGKTMHFLSLYNFASNLGSLKTWAEWTVLPAAKALTFNSVGKLSQAIGNTEFLSVTGGTSTVVTAPTAAGITTTEAAGSVVAPLAILGATVGDMDMHSYCSGYGPIPHER